MNSVKDTSDGAQNTLDIQDRHLFIDQYFSGVQQFDNTFDLLKVLIKLKCKNYRQRYTFGCNKLIENLLIELYWDLINSVPDEQENIHLFRCPVCTFDIDLKDCYFNILDLLYFDWLH